MNKRKCLLVSITALIFSLIQIQGFAYSEQRNQSCKALFAKVSGRWNGEFTAVDFNRSVNRGGPSINKGPWEINFKDHYECLFWGTLKWTVKQEGPPAAQIQETKPYGEVEKIIGLIDPNTNKIYLVASTERINVEMYFVKKNMMHVNYFTTGDDASIDVGYFKR